MNPAVEKVWERLHRRDGFVFKDEEGLGRQGKKKR